MVPDTGVRVSGGNASQWNDWGWYYDSSCAALTTPVSRPATSSANEPGSDIAGSLSLGAGAPEGTTVSGRPPLGRKASRKALEAAETASVPIATPTPLKPASSKQRNSEYRTPAGAASMEGASPMARFPRHISPADAAARGEDQSVLRKKKKKRLLRMEGGAAAVEATPFKKRRPVGSSPGVVHAGPSPIALGSLKDREADGGAAGGQALEQYIEAMDQAAVEVTVKKLRPAIPPYIPNPRKFVISNAVMVSDVLKLFCSAHCSISSCSNDP